MSGTPKQEQRAGEQHEAHEDGKRSGEGANTALEALIRQRKLAEGPEPTDPLPAG